VPLPRRELFVSITPTRPVGLSQLFLLSLSDAAFSSADLSPAIIESHLVESQRIVRQGDILSIPSSRHNNERGTKRASHDDYRVVMAEPVLQGVVVPGRTKFVVLPASSSVAATSSRAADDLFALDIDESFLAPSLMDDLLSVGDRPAQDGISSPHVGSRSAGFSAVLQAAPLQSTIEDEEVFPRPSNGEDDETRAFLSASELARRGARSGDWALLRPPAGTGDRGNGEKLVRVFALPQAHEHLLYLSPPLLCQSRGLTGTEQERPDIDHLSTPSHHR
jgi:peroxin-6